MSGQGENDSDMSDKQRVLIISEEGHLGGALGEAVGQLNLESHLCRLDEAAARIGQLGEVDAAILALDRLDGLQEDSEGGLVEQLRSVAKSVLVLAGEVTGACGQGEVRPDGFFCAGRDESAEMLKGRLATLLEMDAKLRGLHADVDRLDRVNQPLTSHFAQVDEEMRLAARLQRDFLPRQLPEIEGINFATVFRPASWVSGDIYDIVRLDEKHVGFYIADAVGHGMPAALLTIFIKQALVTKRIEGNTYMLVDPGEVLKHLNNEMVAQELSNFQFATCCYGLLNIESLELRIASGGHPAPMLIGRDAQSREVEVSGSLLGVFKGIDFETQTVQLQRGEKLLLYSDGVEVAFVNEGPDEPLRFRGEFGNLAHYDIEAMCAKLVEIIDREEGSLHPKDDVTIVGIELT